MKFNEVKQYAKKDKSATFYMSLHRKLGLYLAWIILNLFPSASANIITLSMLPLNILAAGFLYYGVVSSSYLFLVISFVFSFVAFTLDCTDGNVARIKKSASIRGVYYDRLVHNISHPLFFFVLGFALYASSDQIVYLIIFILAGILSELSPIDVSQKDVETLFIRQAFLHATINYDVKTHQRRMESEKQLFILNKKNTLRKLIQTVLENDSFYVMLILDMLLFENHFYLTSIFAFVYILGFIYVKSNISRWEADLNEVLDRLNSDKR